MVMGMFGGTGSSRRARRAVVIAAAAILAALGASPVTLAAKKRHRPPTPAQQYARARTQLSHISKSAFNKGRRAALLRVAAQGARTVKSRQRCRALGAIDRLLNATGTPSTWKRGRIPKGGRAAIGVLTKAETAQLKLAGRKCAQASKPTRIRGKRGGSGAPKTAPPPVSPEQGEGFNPKLPTGPLRVPQSIGPGSGLGADPHGAGLPGSHDKRATAAADPLTFFRISDVGIPPRTASPMEPTVAIGGHVVWYTGNTSVGLSTNDGRTFTLFDPSNVLPDQGLAFCCDQLVSYDAPDNMFVWVSQYWCNEPGGSCFGKDAKGNNVCQTNGAFNRIRIAVASPQDLIRNASNPGLAWTYWDITPSTVGQPSNAWFDRSDLSLNAWNMDWTVDVLCGTRRIGARADLAVRPAQARHRQPRLHAPTAAAERGPGHGHDHLLLRREHVDQPLRRSGRGLRSPARCSRTTSTTRRSRQTTARSTAATAATGTTATGSSLARSRVRP